MTMIVMFTPIPVMMIIIDLSRVSVCFLFSFVHSPLHNKNDLHRCDLCLAYEATFSTHVLPFQFCMSDQE